MSKSEKTAMVPRLRFPEFRSTGEWHVCTLRELASKITARNQDNSVKRVLTNSATAGVVDQRDYFDREVANQDNLENYFVIDKGDYVYNPRISVTAPVGPISKNKIGKGVMSPLYTVFRFDEENNDFYEQYFKTSLWHSYLKAVSNTGARHDRMSISNDSFMKLPMPYHSEEEQQKIADCLSSLDDLITAEDKKLAALKEHKKGLMQKLFPAEGKTVPEWRLKGYNDVWKQQRLVEVFGTIRNAFVGTATPFYVERDGYFYLESNNVKDGKINRNKEVFINKDFYMKQKDKWLYEGDLVMVQSGHVGHTAVIPKELNATAAHALIMFQNPANKINPYFISYQLQSYVSKKQLDNITTGNTIQHILASDMKEFTVMMTSEPEQAAIGTLLSNLDNLITLQAKKIEALKSHKKGLMQGLFPTIEEVSE